ncbi:MAG: VOC family protein [Candidatus Eisenbacteria bacterium]|nr:VOC family protein [Candidatus Eisenbacteria bacterium]
MAALNHPPGTFCWFECGSTDASKSKPFYEHLFGWQADDMPMPEGGGSYTILKSAGESVAGLYQLSGPQYEGVPSHWMTYVSVENIDETTRRAAELGAKILAEPMEVPEVGRISALRDPTGAVISLAHFDKHPGTSKNGPFGWSELATRDTAQAGQFYTKLLGWGLKEDPEHRYTEFQVSGRSVGGMMAMSPQQADVPPHWLPYVMVGDADSIARKVRELGGKVYVEPTDIPDVGRFCVFADPAGAVLAVIQMRGR